MAFKRSTQLLRTSDFGLPTPRNQPLFLSWAYSPLIAPPFLPNALHWAKVSWAFSPRGGKLESFKFVTLDVGKINVNPHHLC